MSFSAICELNFGFLRIKISEGDEDGEETERISF